MTRHLALDVEPLGAALEQIVHDEVATGRGAQIAVWSDARGMRTWSSGMADSANAVGADTLFRVSCGLKPLLAYAVLVLVEEGRLGLDEPLAGYVGAFRDPRKNTITVRHALTHTSGLLEGIELAQAHGRGTAAVIRSIDETPYPDGWAPGRQAAYTAVYDWQLLARTLEVVTHRPPREQLREVAVALGMERTTFGLSEPERARLAERIGLIYQPTPARRGTVPCLMDRRASTTDELFGLSGYSTATDMATFYAVALAASGPTPGDQAFRRMSTPTRERVYDHVARRVLPIGMGVDVDLRCHQFGDRLSARSFGHSAYGGNLIAFADPVVRVAAAVVVNDVLPRAAGLQRTRRIVDTLIEFQS
jgi:CubicO group peptidase (beta-lactamase class C family)